MLETLTKYGVAAFALGMLTMVPLAEQAQAFGKGVRYPGGLTCRVMFGKAHFHKGRSGHRATKHEAMQAALARWAGFTVWEYGAAYGNFRLARSKSWNCGPSHRGGWKCKVKAQPCRR